MNDVKLGCVLDETDLEVIVSDNLKSRKQYSEATKKANRIPVMIRQNFTHRSRETITDVKRKPNIRLPLVEALTGSKN